MPVGNFIIYFLKQRRRLDQNRVKPYSVSGHKPVFYTVLLAVEGAPDAPSVEVRIIAPLHAVALKHIGQVDVLFRPLDRRIVYERDQLAAKLHAFFK